MKLTGTAIKLGAFSFVLLLFTAIIIIVFGQIRFDRTTAYTAEFSSASGLRPGQFVRAGGVEVGKVSKLQLMDDGRRVLVTLNVDKTLPLYQSTTATIRYQDLIGNRYVNLERGTGEAFAVEDLGPVSIGRFVITIGLFRSEAEARTSNSSSAS